MEEVKKYLLDIGFDDAHFPELFNDDDKSTYTIPELMQAYADHKLKLLDIPVVEKQSELFECRNVACNKMVKRNSGTVFCKKHRNL